MLPTLAGGATKDAGLDVSANQTRSPGRVHPDTAEAPQPGAAPAPRNGSASGKAAAPPPAGPAATDANATFPALPAQASPAPGGTAATSDTDHADPPMPDRPVGRIRPEAAAQHTAAEAAGTAQSTPASAAVIAATAEPAAGAAASATPAVAAAAQAGKAVPSVAAPAAAATTAPEAAAIRPTPAAQAMPALVSLGGSRGTTHVTVRLDPQELGQVQIRVEQPNDGPARVTLTAQRPQTLDLLVRDQAQLHHALDQAGVPAEGRSITFHLAPSTASPDAISAGIGAGTGGSGSDRTPQHALSAPQPRRSPAAQDDSATDLNSPIQAAPRRQRAGIDITA